MEMVQFQVSLGEDDWDNDLGAWRCPALRAPGAKLAKFYSRGSRGTPEHPDTASADTDYVYWKTAKKRPVDATAVIAVPANKKDGLDFEQVRLKRSQVRWKGMAALATVVGPIVGGLLARCTPEPPIPPPPPAPVSDAGVKEAGPSKPEDACEADDTDCWRKRLQDASWIASCLNEHLIGAVQIQGATERCRQLGADHHNCLERQGALERAKALDCNKLTPGHIGY